jgi:hypothetical protein
MKDASVCLKTLRDLTRHRPELASKPALIGTVDEDSGKALADRIQKEAPAGSQVKVEGTWAAAYGGRAPNPFAVLGGLGG